MGLRNKDSKPNHRPQEPYLFIDPDEPYIGNARLRTDLVPEYGRQQFPDAPQNYDAKQQHRNSPKYRDEWKNFNRRDYSTEPRERNVGKKLRNEKARSPFLRRFGEFSDMRRRRRKDVETDYTKEHDLPLRARENNERRKESEARDADRRPPDASVERSLDVSGLREQIQANAMHLFSEVVRSAAKKRIRPADVFKIVITSSTVYKNVTAHLLYRVSSDRGPEFQQAVRSLPASSIAGALDNLCRTTGHALTLKFEWNDVKHISERDKWEDGTGVIYKELLPEEALYSPPAFDF